MRVLEEVMNSPERGWVGRKRRARCMGHTVQLAAHDFIEAVCPTPSSYKHKVASKKAAAAKKSKVTTLGGLASVEDYGDEDEDENGNQDGLDESDNQVSAIV